MEKIKMPEEVDCEAPGNDNANEILAKKQEVQGTNLMYVKNCCTNLLQLKDVNDNIIEISKNEYRKFQPKKQ